MSKTLEEALVLAKGPLSRLALRYSFVMKDLVAKAKDPAFTASDWGPLAASVADDFVRIGNFRERVTWSQYDDLLTMWGKTTDWDFTVERVTEGEGCAILELEETARYGDREETYSSVSVYEFDADDKLKRLKIYLSKAEPLGAAEARSWDWQEVKAEIV